MAAPIVSGIAALMKSSRPFLESFAVRQALRAVPGPDAVAALQASSFSRSACLYLQVLWQGEPVPEAEVSLVGGEAFFAQTDDRGEVKFLQIPPGDYQLAVSLSTPQGRRYHEERKTIGISCLLPYQVLLP